jgi:hypothetical protein
MKRTRSAARHVATGFIVGSALWATCCVVAWAQVAPTGPRTAAPEVKSHCTADIDADGRPDLALLVGAGDHFVVLVVRHSAAGRTVVERVAVGDRLTTLQCRRQGDVIESPAGAGTRAPRRHTVPAGHLEVGQPEGSARAIWRTRRGNVEVWIRG